MNRRILNLLLALVFPLIAGAQTLTATLSGANEVGGGAPGGSGIAVVTFNGTQVSYTILVSGFDTPTVAHIHTGAAGTNGTILIDFAPTFVAGSATGTVNTSSANAAAVLANPAGFYVNVHSGQFPNGAVRGQLALTTTNAGNFVSWIPAVGKSRGANDTNFVTDLRIVNDSGAVANVTLDYFQSSLSGQTAPTATKSITVVAGEEKVLDDLLAGTFALDNQLGGLKVTSDRNVVVIARVFNDLRAQGLGTTGLAVPALTEVPTSGVLPFLSQASDADFAARLGFRTNVGYFNPSPTSVTVTFTARRASDGAVLGTSSREIPGFSHAQGNVYDIIPAVPASDRAQENFYVTWTSTGPVFVYGAIVDNKTGDSVYVD